jgi:hypothetical protein
MVAGARPFSGETAIETLDAIVNGDSRRLPADAGITPAVAHVIAHCLERQAAARFQSASDLAFVLDLALRTLHLTRRPATERRTLSAVLRRR